MSTGLSLSRRWVAILVAGVAFAAHASTLGAGFVYDDHRFISQNEAIRSIDPVAFFTEAETTSAGEGVTHDIYRPLRTLLFSVEYALFGDDPTGWHVISVLLHALNAALVLLLLVRLVPGQLLACGIGAALFAVHPITSESVAWVSSQGDLLALTFMLLSLSLFARTGPRRTAGGAALFMLACFAKESALVLPALVILQDLVLRRRALENAPTRRETMLRVLVLGALTIGYFALRVSVVPTIRQVPHPGGVGGTVAGMFEGMAWYGSMLVAPRGFPFDLRYHVPLSFGEPMVILGMSLLAVLVITGIYGLRAKRYALAFFAFGFLACLVPVSNVIVPLKTFIADRFLYPGLICLALGAVLGLTAIARNWRQALPYVGVVLIGVLTVLTSIRGRAWADELTLWKAVRADRPTNANAYQGIAYELAARGEVSDAERAFRTYIDFNPIDGKAWVVLGDTFERTAKAINPTVDQGQSTNMIMRRRQARAAQMTAYREALRVWGAFGLEMGRGSPELRTRMFQNWFRAAHEFKDFAEMKRVNDWRVLYDEGIDPNDRDAFWKGAKWRSRAFRFLIVVEAVQAQIAKQEMPPARMQRALADRAMVIADLGLDPAQSDESLRGPFARLVERETRRAAKAGAPVSEADFLAAATLLITIRDKRGAAEMVGLALRSHPESQQLQQMRGILSQ